MKQAVVFSTDRYCVRSKGNGAWEPLHVYTTLTGECREQEQNKAPDEVRNEYNALPS